MIRRAACAIPRAEFIRKRKDSLRRFCPPSVFFRSASSHVAPVTQQRSRSGFPRKARGIQRPANTHADSQHSGFAEFHHLLVEYRPEGVCLTMSEQILMTPIAHVANAVPAPIDDIWGGVRSEIRLSETHFTTESLAGLDEFSHTSKSSTCFTGCRQME